MNPHQAAVTGPRSDADAEVGYESIRDAARPRELRPCDSRAVWVCAWLNGVEQCAYFDTERQAEAHAFAIRGAVNGAVYVYPMEVQP